MEGSLEFAFVVPKKGIRDMIMTNSFYRGERVKDENGAHAARMQAGEDNDDVLMDEIQLATADVVALITRNLGRCTVATTGENFTFSGTGASNFPYDDLKTSVEDLIKVYLFDKALEGWMLINMPNEVQALGQRSVADAEKLRLILVERKKPVR
jgi:hypothetical protein